MDDDNSVRDMPAHWFERVDNAPDEAFYQSPRFVAHIDQATIDALTEFYRDFISVNSDVLDLMSSWISHLPPDLDLSRVAGLGMNEAELTGNDRLSDWCVHNLNETPNLPYSAGTFDFVLIAVSVQYLTQPLEVFASIHATLRPEGKICVAMSHRLFPTKAIAAFQQMSPQDRVRLVSFYLEQAGFEDVAFEDRSPPGADPLWLVTAQVATKAIEK